MLAMQIQYGNEEPKDIGMNVVKAMFDAYKQAQGTEIEAHIDITTIKDFIKKYYSEEEYPEMWI